ncbi:phosphate regulon sensor protein PhoR [Geomicrobium sp. JCM 19038]|nr:phosphate regulon sensor protein PhoR [Geomicrobium sp. JCM 19038]
MIPLHFNYNGEVSKVKGEHDMSIRIKLLLSYVLMTIIPIGLFILFLHLLFQLFLTNIDDMKQFYSIENGTVEDFFYDELVAVSSLQQIASTDPNALLNESVISEFEGMLNHRQIDIVVRRDDQIIHTTFNEDQPNLPQLPTRQTPNHDGLLNDQGYLRNGDHSWAYVSSDFYFDDDRHGSLFITLDLSPVDAFLTQVVPFVIAGFIFVYLLTNAVITYVFSKHIILPLKKLNTSAQAIANGDLNQQTAITRQDEVGELAAAFENMRIQLRQSKAIQESYEANRKALINNISHDLKTPITSIQGHVQGILDGVAEDQNKLEKYMQIIHSKSTEMDKLIDELFLYSKLDMNSIPFQFENVNLTHYLHDIKETFELEYENITFLAELEIDPTTMVVADRDQLYKVFVNITSNSVKFMNKANKTIKLSAMLDGSYVSIAMTDNGSGVEKQEIPYLFDRFYRTEASQSSERNGSGIGLAIVKQIIDAHGGSVHVHSVINEGTTITFALPIAQQIETKENEDEANSNY